LLLEKSKGNFLYIQQALEGVEREMYSFEDLVALPPGLAGLYQGFSERVFTDESSYVRARSILQVLVATQEPLTEDQLAEATVLDVEEELPAELRRLHSYLSRQIDASGCVRYAIFHESLAGWLTDPRQRGSRYYVSRRLGHRRIADLCWQQYEQRADTLSKYALAHLPAHLLAAERWDELRKTLTDLDFVEAKCSRGNMYDLGRDYSAALNALPEFREERVSARNRHETLARFTESLMDYSRAWTQRVASDQTRETKMPVAPRTDSVRLSPKETMGTHFATAENPEGSTVRLRAFAAFIASHGHLIARSPEETVTLARNHAVDGPMVEQAESFVASLSRVWVARDPRPPAPPVCSEVVRTILAHRREVAALTVTPDGQHGVTVGSDPTLRTWRLGSGEEGRVLRIPVQQSKVAVSADGRVVISAGDDGKLHIWNLDAREERHEFVAHEARITAVAVTPDERRGVSVGLNETISVWDLGAAARERSFVTEGVRGTCVAITASGRLAVTGNRDATVQIWSLESGESAGTLEGHEGVVTCVAITPDGKTALSGSADGTFRLWDLGTKKERGVVTELETPAIDVAISPDGNVGLSGGPDRVVRVWDLARRKSLRVLRGHTGRVVGVALSADGETAVSASRRPHGACLESRGRASGADADGT
jgi:hypothetical protein